MSDQSIEQEIQAKGLTAPRVTPDDLAANIASEHYFTAAAGAVASLPKNATDEQINAIPHSLSLLTFCVLVLKNGFTVTGESACASPENFDAELGRKIARANAINKVWPLMGYHLKQQLHEHQQLLDGTALPFSIQPDEERAARTYQRSWQPFMDRLQPHERRIIIESIDLKLRTSKLGDFIDNSDTFMALPPEQQLLLVRQHRLMTEYAEVLDERTQAFKESVSTPPKDKP